MSANLHLAKLEELKVPIEQAELAPDQQEEFDAHLLDAQAHDETISQALRNHPWTMLWVIYGVWIIACFDNNAGGTVLGIPRFRQDFGYFFEGDYILVASWQSAMNGGPAAFQVAGTFLAGTLGEKIGRRGITMVCYAILMVGITIEFVANKTPNPIAVFFAGKCFNGFAVGCLLTTGMIYISEIAPLVLRGICVAAGAVAFCVGTLVLALIVNAYGTLDNEWAYLSAIITQYFVTGIGIVFVFWMPESPNWAMTKAKHEVALRSSKKLGMTDVEASRSLLIIQMTIDKAAAETEGASYAQLFRKTNRRRTMVASMPLAIQPFTGVLWVAGYFLYYTQLAGFSTSMSYKLNITQQVLSTAGNITSWFLVESFGRRPLSFYGLVILTVLLLVAGALAMVNSVEAIKACVALILLYCYLYNATIGATSFIAMSEIGSTRLRNKTGAFALAFKGLWDTMWSFTLPYLFNPNAANLQAKVAFLFGGTSILSCIYLYFCHPESKGRSFEEIDELFLKQVPARKFGSTVTDAQLRNREVKEQAGRSNVGA